jgi:serine/threonine-protein kinase
MDNAFGRRSVVAEIGGLGAAPESAADGGKYFVPAAEKYDTLGSIGDGGMGSVMLVRDNDLKRDVAMKVIRTEFAEHPAMKRRFVAEAQATSQLEHPGIPPVHDVGTTPDGKVYFTMKVVRGDTLQSLLKKLLLGVKEVRQEYSLHRLVTVLERIAEAVHFAHEKGVLHRDLKPENIMLGAYGEVHVMDWGIAKVAAEPDADATGEDAVRTVETDQALKTQLGTVKGTVPYMSPEQARGEPLDRRSDVYALGSILYEMLTLHPAFEGTGVQLVLKVRAGEFPPVETRNPRRPVPEALATICRRAMSFDAAARPATARAMAADLRNWLDGRAEKERRHREAEALAAEGREAMGRYVAATRSVQEAQTVLDAAETNVKAWQTLAEKAPLLAARRAVVDARRAVALAFAETTKLLEGALLAEPDNAGARAALSDLWRGRLDGAESRGAADDAAHAETMVRRYDDGRLAAYVAGDGSLELASDPPGAAVSLVRFEDRDGLLVAGPELDLGATPLRPTPLAMGSYLAVLRHAGFPDVRYPVHIRRNQVWRDEVKLRTREELGDEFVFVPAGPFLFGEGRGARIVELPDFAIAKSPTTFGDWAEFLAAVEASDGLDAATKLCPGTPGDGPYMERVAPGVWRTLPNNCEGAARERCLATYGADFDRLLPVAGVSWHEAVLYCAWKTRTTGRDWRLPTEEEREKAARGVDGRRFPWGDVEDASLGKCRDSRPETAQPEPVGAFPAATSVYGMVDACGNSWDWTDSWFDGRQASRVLRGGAWLNFPSYMRCADRNSGSPDNRSPISGFRCARRL